MFQSTVRLRPQPVARFIRDPRQLPLNITAQSYYKLKAGGTTIYAANSSSFMNAVVNHGGATATIATTNTYYTVVDITGKGLFGWVLGPATDNSGDITQTYKFTIDGGVTEISVRVPISYKRAILGGCRAQTGSTASTPYNYTIAGRGSVPYGSYINAFSVMPIATMFATGASLLRFDTGFKLEIKVSAGASSEACCDYRVIGA